MQLLKIRGPELIDRISADLPRCLDHFLEEEVITVIDKEEIEAEREKRGPFAGACKLVEKIPTKIRNWPQKIIAVAKKCNMDDIVDMLEVPEGMTDLKR